MTWARASQGLWEAFRKHGVRVDRIVSSPARCLETGQLMAVGLVETSWPLFLIESGCGPGLELKEMVSPWRGLGTLVLVTHALTAGPRVLPATGRNGRASTDAWESTGGHVVGRDRAAPIATDSLALSRPMKGAEAKAHVLHLDSAPDAGYVHSVVRWCLCHRPTCAGGSEIARANGKGPELPVELAVPPTRPLCGGTSSGRSGCRASYRVVRT
jgi:hypothetical protein